MVLGDLEVIGLTEQECGLDEDAARLVCGQDVVDSFDVDDIHAAVFHYGHFNAFIFIEGG